jgi:hypothetical protein
MHYKTFHDQLNAYFEDANSQTLAWVGMLYAILCLAMQSYSKIGDEPPEWRGRLSLFSFYTEDGIWHLKLTPDTWRCDPQDKQDAWSPNILECYC